MILLVSPSNTICSIVTINRKLVIRTYWGLILCEKIQNKYPHIHLKSFNFINRYQFITQFPSKRQLRMNFIKFNRKGVQKFLHNQICSPEIKNADIINIQNDPQKNNHKSTKYIPKQPNKDIEDCFKMVSEMSLQMVNMQIQEKLNRLDKKIEEFEGSLFQLMKKYNIVDFLLNLLLRTQDSIIQFSSLKILKRIITQYQQSPEQESEQLLKKIAIGLFGEITNSYQQFYRRTLDILAKMLTKKPKISVVFLEKQKISMISIALKEQFSKFDKNHNLNQRERSLNILSKENSLQNTLRIFDIILTNSPNHPNQFPQIKEIVLETIKYLLEKSISPDFAARLMHILKVYVRNMLIKPKQFLFIFQYTPLLIKVLMLFDGKKMHILQLFKYGISIQKIILQAEIKEDMLYCLQKILQNGRPQSKEAFWAILVHIKSGYCIEAILKRESLISKLLDLLNTESIRNKVSLVTILNYYVETTKRQQNRNILSQIIKTSINLINSSDQNEILAGLDLLDRIMVRSRFFNFKINQFNRLKGSATLKTLWKYPHQNVQEKANQVLEKIKLTPSPKEKSDQISRYTDDHE